MEAPTQINARRLRNVVVSHRADTSARGTERGSMNDGHRRHSVSIDYSLVSYLTVVREGNGHTNSDWVTDGQCQWGDIPYLSGDFSLSHRPSSLSLIYPTVDRRDQENATLHWPLSHDTRTPTSSCSCDIDRNRPIHMATYRRRVSPQPWRARGREGTKKGLPQGR